MLHEGLHHIHSSPSRLTIRFSRKKQQAPLIVILALFATFMTNPALATMDGDALFNLSLIELANIDVSSATRRPQPLKDLPATVYVFTQHDFARYGFRDLKDVLKYTAGIEYGDSHSWLQGGQRGFTGTWSHTRILIDGRDADKTTDNQAHISHQYPLYNIKQVEIIQGPASSLYGADVFAGLINLVTKTHENSETGQDSSFTLGEGEDKLSSKQLTYSNVYQKERLGITFHSSWLDQTDPDYTNYVLSDDYSFLNQTDRTRFFNEGNPYKDDNRGVNLNLILNYEVSTHDDFKIGFDYRSSHDGGGIENPELIYTNFKETLDQDRIFVNYKKDMHEMGTLSFDYQYLKDDTIYDFNLRNLDQGDPPPLVQYAQRNSELQSSQIQYDRNFKALNNYLVLSYSHKEYELSKPIFELDSFNELKPFLKHTLNSFFIQDQQTFLDDRFLLTLGYRHDDSNLYDNIETIRGALQYNINHQYSVKILYGEAFREPTVFELSNNPSLNSATVKTTELVLDANPNDHLNFKLATYTSKARDIIGENRQDTDGPLVNIDKKTINGSEAFMRWHTGQLSGFLSSSYLDVDDMLDLARYKFGWGLSHELSEKWTFSIIGKYISTIDTKAMDANENLYIEKVPAFYDMDITLLGSDIINWPYSKVGISFSVHNIFDRENYYPNPRGPDPIKFLANQRSYFIKTSLKF